MINLLFPALFDLIICTDSAALPSVNHGEIIWNYLSIIYRLFVFSKIIELFVDYLSKNVPYFRQDYLGLFELVEYLHYLRLLQIIADYFWIICFVLLVDYLKHGLFEIIANYCRLFLDYLFWIICGLFETWIIWDYLSLDYL